MARRALAERRRQALRGSCALQQQNLCIPCWHGAAQSLFHAPQRLDATRPALPSPTAELMQQGPGRAPIGLKAMPTCFHAEHGLLSQLLGSCCGAGHANRLGQPCHRLGRQVRHSPGHCSLCLQRVGKQLTHEPRQVQGAGTLQARAAQVKQFLAGGRWQAACESPPPSPSTPAAACSCTAPFPRQSWVLLAAFRLAAPRLGRQPGVGRGGGGRRACPPASS